MEQQKKLTLGEQFDRIETILSKLPLGYAFEIKYGTNGTQPPEMTVEIQGDYDDFVHDYEVLTRSARTDYHEEKDFENLVAWAQHTLTKILEKQKQTEVPTSSESEEEYTPF